MLIPFIKMNAQGNDFVILDYFAPELVTLKELNYSSLALEVCRPHFGIGADGLVLLKPSTEFDAQMIIFNADGSQA